MMGDRFKKSILRVGPGSSGVGESHAPSSDSGRPSFTEGPLITRKDEGAAKVAKKEEEAAKAARQRAILAALSGDGGKKKSDSPKPAPITAPAKELLTDEDVDFSQPQPNGVERNLRLLQKMKNRGDKNLPRVLLTRDVIMPPPSTGRDNFTGRDSSRGRVFQHGYDAHGRDSEDWLSDSSEMSGMSLDSGGLPPFLDRTRRKRRSDEDMTPPPGQVLPSNQTN